MDSAIYDDAELVERFWNNDIDAFEILVRKYQENLYQLVKGLISNLEDVEDCYQEALAKIYVAMSQKRGPKPPGNFWPYLRTIANNTVMDEFRFRKKKRAKEEELAEILKMEADTNLLMAIEIHEMIDKLPEKESVVIELYYMEGYGVDEISEILGYGQPWVSKKKSRGEKLLKKYFKNN